jgi:hypothetical protein
MIGCAVEGVAGFPTEDASSTFAVCSVDAGADAGTSIINVELQSPNPWLLVQPRIHIIFLGSWWLTDSVGAPQFDQMAQAWNTLANEPNFYAPLSQYGISPGSLAGIFNTDYDLPIGELPDEDFTKELQAEINDGTLPANDSNSVYVMMLPPATQSTNDISCCSGHHNQVNGIAYAIIEYQSNWQFMDVVTSHEIFEASSDSAPNDPITGGWRNGPSGGEIADLCENLPSVTLDGYQVQQVWDQQNCKCVP